MFEVLEIEGKRVLKSSLAKDDAVELFFTTRDFPLKSAQIEKYDGIIAQNISKLAAYLNVSEERICMPVQTHSDNVLVLSEIAEKLELDGIDAVVTNLKNIPLVLNFADCVPIILYDDIKKVIAVVHAGWRGTSLNIVSKTLDVMINKFDVSVKNVVALIGPAIGQCCFEVKDDAKVKILDSIDSSVISHVHINNNIDLKLVNKFQLLAGGVEKIDVSGYCTSCSNELFFSYRKENGKCARHSAVAMLK